MNIKQNSSLITAMSLCALLSACGGSSSDSSSSSGGGTTPATSINVALPANGATVTATYGGVMANFVNDGDSANTNNFWSGLVANDKVTIDFGKTRSVTNITVYTNDTSYSSSNPSKYIEVSSDNVTWKSTAQPFAGDIACSTFSTGKATISCTFLTAQTLRYFRVRVVGTTPNATQIYEMEATGQ